MKLKVAKEILHPGGKRRLRIYERSDGNFAFFEEAEYTNGYDPNAPFNSWPQLYERPGIYGSIEITLREIAALPEYKDYKLEV
jgi:hypothetical protein